MESLGITGVHSAHFAVHSLDRARAMFETQLGFQPLHRASAELVSRSGQDSIVYGAGTARFAVSEPKNESCRAARYLRHHPEGVMSLSFAVRDVKRTFSLLDARGATPLSDPFEAPGYRDFEIATPLGDVQFRFIESTGEAFAPGFERAEGQAGAIPWMGVDHFTVNTRTMKPFIDWCASVLGFTQFWEIQFHTMDLDAGKKKTSGSGLKSIVMWDPESGVKIATNEPMRPFFRTSQIEKFVEDNHGNGVQHIAIGVPSIIHAVDALNSAGLKFLSAPDTYYRRLPERFAAIGFDFAQVREPVAELEKRGILVDGSKDGYMLQIFTDELGMIGKAGEANPAFFEVIQREGDKGFGYGNFRALFEAIESAQAERA
jgi:4-hydroxyphenylpyruvate dioxygenase